MSEQLTLREARTKRQKDKVYKNSRSKFRSSMKPTRTDHSPSDQSDEKTCQKKKSKKEDDNKNGEKKHGEGSADMGKLGDDEELNAKEIMEDVIMKVAEDKKKSIAESSKPKSTKKDKRTPKKEEKTDKDEEKKEENKKDKEDEDNTGGTKDAKKSKDAKKDDDKDNGGGGASATDKPNVDENTPEETEKKEDNNGDGKTGGEPDAENQQLDKEKNTGEGSGVKDEAETKIGDLTITEEKPVAAPVERKTTHFYDENGKLILSKIEGYASLSEYYDEDVYDPRMDADSDVSDRYEFLSQDGGDGAGDYSFDGDDDRYNDEEEEVAAQTGTAAAEH